MRLIFFCILVFLGSILSIPGIYALETPEEFRVKPEQVFTFKQKPSITRKGDSITITFETEGFCDCTIAIENKEGNIIRHLASGVLGKNAPLPFQKNSKKQAIVWDGKNDQERYVDDKDNVVVRVSLGLKPRFERSLYWSPHKRFGSMPLLAAAPEGVYVFDGRGVDFLRLFDHEGNYIRTVYPFPRKQTKKVKGLDWYDFPQGYRLPRKGGLYQHTLLTSGANFHSGNHGVSRKANGASAMAVKGSKIGIAQVKLNRLSTDGSTGGFELQGPHTGYQINSVQGGLPVDVGPSSMAFSPDGKTLYLTGYMWRTGSWRRVPGCYHAVFSLEYSKNEKPKVFLGHRVKHGQDQTHFRVPTSVATDSKGRVYVSDFLNDRIQIYNSSGKHLNTIKISKPAKVCVHQKTGEIWVFSYPVMGVPYDLYKQYGYAPTGIKHTLTRHKAFPSLKKISSEHFPLGPGDSMGFEATGHIYHAELDSWADKPTVWVVGRKHQARGAEFHFSPGYNKTDLDPRLLTAGVRIQRKVKGKWEVVHAFGDKTVKKVKRGWSPRHNIQRLYTNPVTGLLYVAEADSGPTIKASNSWLEINPDTGSIKVIPLPFNAMEGAFDLNGNVYLRNTNAIVRYSFPEFREIPWDYGEERPSLGNDGGIHGKTTRVLSALIMPTTSPVCYHQGGIFVSPTGNVIASCAYRYVGISSGRLSNKKVHQQDVYKPRLYPGRIVNSTSPCIHVWDKHGKLKYEDAIPGIGQCDGVAIDTNDNIYAMHAPGRRYNKKRYFNHMSQTLMKVKPNKTNIISSGRAPIKLNKAEAPKREADLWSTRHGNAWAENAEWLYGGVGFAGFNMIGHGGGCACWFSRFTLDHFARSIAPEPYQYRVAVLDTAGNLILHIGQYGNAEDGIPTRNAERGTRSAEPPNQRSIGGDEVSLVHACFVGTHTDRRIFISDMGNARIVSVKLGYHTDEKISLSDIPNLGN